MRRIEILGFILAAVLAVAAVGAASASASPKLLSLYFPEGGLRAPDGEALELRPSAAHYHAIEREGSCTYSLGDVYEGTLTANAQKTDTLLLESDRGGRCDNEQRRYAITAVPTGLPWTLSLGANGKATLTSAYTTELGFEVYVEAFIERHFLCTYAGSKLSGHETLGGPLAVSLSGNLKHKPGQPKECNKPMEISGWELPVDAGEGPLYDLVE